jgi:hypothetical protein
MEDLTMKNDTTTSLSRRRLLASVLAAAAAGVPSVATALGGVPAEGDAELLALGRELAPLVTEINAARAIDRKDKEDFEAKLAALGLKDETEYANVDAYNEVRWRLCEESRELQRALDVDDDYRHRSWDDLHDELFALQDEILAIRPTTIPGFAVQVVAIVTAYDDLCDEEEEMHSGLAAFFRNMCNFVGVPAPV